jgi:uncharacterized YigZ family protein
MDPDFYQTIEKTAVAEFKDRGSQFIAYTFPIADIAQFKTNLTSIKKEHPKATHHCFAYRLGLDGNTFRVSDDGEPSGSAGRPILGQIDSRQLTNVLVIVVRYFGGTLLGVPGLINAYKTAASLSLQITPAIRKAIEISFRLEFDYTLMNDVMIIARQCNCTILKQEMQLFCSMDIGVPKNRLEEWQYKMKELHAIETKLL